MLKIFADIRTKLRSYRKEEDAVAATEAAMVFPVLLTLLLGTFDMGFGILAAQKTIRSSQVTADLIARHREVNEDEINEAIAAGRVALNPFDTSDYEYEIVSVEFEGDECDNIQTNVLWRRASSGMTPNQTALNSLQGLGCDGEGVIVVTVNFEFHPVFAKFLLDTYPFQEVSFTRGRITPTVPLES